MRVSLHPVHSEEFLNDKTIPQLKVKAICGSANNQLLEIEKHGQALQDLGIVYAPDYVVNSGGVINVADELTGYNKERATSKVKDVYKQIDKIFTIAKEQNISPQHAADHLAESRIQAIQNVKSKFTQSDKNILSGRKK